MKIGTRVQIKVGSNPTSKGRVAGAKITQSNGVFIPVNVAPEGSKVKDVRNYRAVYLTALDENGEVPKAVPAAKPVVKAAVKAPAVKPVAKAAPVKAPAKKVSAKKAG